VPRDLRTSPAVLPADGALFSAPAGADGVIALVAFAGVVALATVGATGRVAAVVELTLAASALGIACAALGERAAALLRRGVLHPDLAVLVAAAAVFILGARQLAAGIHPGVLGSGTAAAAGIAAFLLCTRLAQGRVSGRVRRGAPAELRAVLEALRRAEIQPPAGSWDEAAWRGLSGASLCCASYAVVAHASTGGGPLAAMSAVAVIAVASPSALLAAGPVARAAAVIGARRRGARVLDPAALAALAAVDVACFSCEPDPALRRALGERGIRAVRLAPGSPAEHALAVRELQLRGARVLVLGDGAIPSGLRPDASIAVGSAEAPLAVDDLAAVPGLVDRARSLRAVLRAGLALAAAHNLVLIPAAALGLIPPLPAAALAVLEAALGLANAARMVAG
jgi:hypothetical protein